MTRKVLAIIGSNPDLKEVCARIDTRNQFMKKQLQSLHEKMEQVKKDAHESSKGDWDIITGIVASDLPEDYNPEKYGLNFSVKENAIYCEEYGDGIPDFIKAIIGRTEE